MNVSWHLSFACHWGCLTAVGLQKSCGSAVSFRVASRFCVVLTGFPLHSFEFLALTEQYSRAHYLSALSPHECNWHSYRPDDISGEGMSSASRLQGWAGVASPLAITGHPAPWNHSHTFSRSTAHRFLIPTTPCKPSGACPGACQGARKKAIAKSMNDL